MMVLKAGAISTLDIIAGIKQKVIDVRDSLPEALKIGFHRRPVAVRPGRHHRRRL